MPSANSSAQAPTPNTQAALGFLKQWRADGPWVLTAIVVERGPTETRTFTEEAAARAWLDKHNGRRNIYFQVNPCTRELTKKARREDVKELAWLHVDIDPRVGEELKDEQDRALGLLQEPPEGVPPPTVIVFSGGGCQGFWKLKEPFQIDGDLARAEQAKLWNIQLEKIFGADQCHNVDRIMRLPGTVNLPDRKKREKGRTETLATLEEFDEDRVYDLCQFVQAPAPQAGDAQRERVCVERVRHLGSVDDLDEWGVPDRVKALVVQGHLRDSEGPKQPNDSRSEWLFDAVCGLVRCGVPDEVIYSVITDPKFTISASVRDKGSRMKGYARRQIARAKEYAIDPQVAELSDRHAIVENIGGKCMVTEEVPNPELEVRELTFISFGTFKARYAHRDAIVGQRDNGQPITKDLGSVWLRRTRNRFHTLRFAPRELDDEVYNTWEGFAVEAVEGDCSLYLNHLREVVCGGGDKYYEWLVRWMAHAVQRPWEPSEVAVVARGGQGVGKGIAFRLFGELFGRHYMQVTNPDHVAGKFNKHLMDKVVVFADEAFYAGDRRHEGVLKALVTESRIVIEPKGVDAFIAKRYFRLLLASNRRWVIPIDWDDRRFFIVNAGSEKRPTEYYRALVGQMDHGGREALLHHLLGVDLTGFDSRSRPETAALLEQKVRSLTGSQNAVHAILATGSLPIGPEHKTADHRRGRVFVATGPLAEKFGVTEKALSPELARASHQKASMRQTIDGHRQRGYWLPVLEEARRLWADSYGLSELCWPEVDHWTDVDPDQFEDDGVSDGDVPF